MVKIGSLGLWAVAAVGVWHVTQTAKQHRQRVAIDTQIIVQELVQSQEEFPECREMWSVHESLPEDERRLMLHCNRWVNLWALEFRVGVMSQNSLRVHLKDFMRRSAGLLYWERVSQHRDDDARDKVDREFNRIANQAYADSAGPLNSI
ncbi:hypothetical protein EYS09_27795 [Streptomyces kasugaensis]|uniref:Peptide transporter permease SapC n=1 Tax=Streptomyces kasugaensis TaxID=1946 RepID=A0A4Q9HP71_STRKA|nr:hypothetical protein EYS09_27795 [Streptomyces kasugaensis]